MLPEKREEVLIIRELGKIVAGDVPPWMLK
jgi:hypothetical protein